MAQASDALTGAVEDIEAFLTGEDYEYTTVKNGDKTVILLKTEDGNAMAIIYDNNEFDSLESSYDKDGKTGYSDIMNGFVKDAIKSGGGSGIKRHKGTKVVSK
jgi:hypothetical protein